MPLHQVAGSATGSLRGAIENLASAYHSFEQANGVGSSVANAVKQASDRINTSCPGAAS
jgi:hypothetical protein